MKELAQASVAAAIISFKGDPKHRESYERLSSILYDLNCYFSDRGISTEQKKRLAGMGFPELQDSDKN
jgi:hypothetical protein